MNKTGDGHTLQPSIVDQGYELQHMSDALPGEAQDVKSSKVSLHHASDPDPASAFDHQSTPLEAASKTSLEILESANRPSQGNGSLSINAPLAPPSTAIPTSFIDVPLPPSSSPSATSLQEPTEATTYRDRISKLSCYFPQLSCVTSQSRHDNTNITIFDYCGHVLCGSRPISMNSTIERGLALTAKLEELHKIVCGNSLWPNVDTRLVIIEDLSTRLIDFLGETFDLSPEFFEEHLHRSGYLGYKANEPSPETWSTSSLQKNYVSVKWYRPVNRWRQEPNTPLQRQTLLNSALKELKGTYRVQTHRQDVPTEVTYSLKTTTNIFRPEFAMSTDPDGVIPLMTPAGWEERATACIVELNQLRYGQLVSPVFYSSIAALTHLDSSNTVG